MKWRWLLWVSAWMQRKKKQAVTRKCLVSLSSCCIGVIVNQMENDWSYHNCKSSIYWEMTYLAQEESQMKGLSCCRVGLSSSALISLTWRWSRREPVEMITISIGATRYIYSKSYLPLCWWVERWTLSLHCPSNWCCFGKRKSRGKATFILVKVDWREKHWHHVNNWELLSRWDLLKIQKMESCSKKTDQNSILHEAKMNLL